MPPLISACGTIIFMFFVSIVAIMVPPFHCYMYPNNRQTVFSSPAVHCWEDGVHERMVFLGSLSLIIPLVFLCCVVWVVVDFPKRLLSSDVDFLNSWGFLVLRLDPKAYWFALA